MQKKQIFRANFFIACLPLLLAGCATLEQQTHTPLVTPLAIPNLWATENTAIKSVPPARQNLAAWWQQFNDPTLEKLITEALRAAPDVRSAQSKLRQSRANRDLATANLFPSLGVSTSTTRARTGTAAGGLGHSQNLYSAGFDASWETSIFGGLRDAANAAEFDAAATAASLESTRAALAAEVALNYITLRTSQRRLIIARDNVASQQETLQITEWRALAGLVTALDVEQARTNLEQSKASIPSLESTLASAEHHLAVLTGAPPGHLHETLATTSPLPEAPDEVAVSIPAETIRQRPDVHAAELALRAEIARTAQQEAARYPSLSLSGTWGWKAFSLAALGDSGSLASSLAGSLAANLFDGGRIRSRIAAQTAVQEQALIGYEKTMLTALEDVENALTAYAVGRERVEARRKAALSARNANALARTLYQAGSTDFQKVLDTDRTRLTAEDGLASAEADVLTALIQLYKALGGGWQQGNTNADENHEST